MPESPLLSNLAADLRLADVLPSLFRFGFDEDQTRVVIRAMRWAYFVGQADGGAEAFAQARAAVTAGIPA